MNGFAERGLDEAAFGEKKGIGGGIRSFDAFREYRKIVFVACLLTVAETLLQLRRKLPTLVERLAEGTPL